MDSEQRQFAAETPTPHPDAKAQAEALAINSGDLERNESLKSHLHRCALVLLWFGLIIFMTCTLAWVYHIVTPSTLHFLQAQDRAQLQGLLLAALGSSFVTEFSRRILQRGSR